MKFKAIFMHTKPLKHAKNIDTLTNYIKQARFFEFFLQKSTFRNVFNDARSHILRKRCASMHRTFLKNTI